MKNRLGYVPLVLLVGMILACGSKPTPKEGDKYGAIVVCEDFVKDRLKAPSTAEFTDEQATLIAGTWTVNGKVDADNAFRAKIRESFACVVKHTGNDKYNLVKLTMPN